MANLQPLLTLQELDTRLDQLRHRLATLPGLEEVAALHREVAEASVAVDRSFAALHELRTKQKALEDEASSVEDKAGQVDAKMYDGSVTSPKELEAFGEDLRMLRERQGVLEDEALEVMELAEPVEAELSLRRAAHTGAEERLADAEARLLVEQETVKAEIAAVEAERVEAADAVVGDVLPVYESLRSSLGGVGVARLDGARCEGCHLEIPSAQLEGLRREPPEAVVNCPECGRILVR